MSQEEKNRQYSVVVIDDEPIVLELIPSLLRPRGYQVQTYSNPFLALEALKTGCFDIVLTDVRMPGLSGIEILDHVHLMCPETPVILMTGFADFSSAVEAVRKEAFDFLLKPFQSEILLHAVKKAVDYLRLREMGKSREQLRALARHLQAARENERIRIAREIHDELAQSLTILKMDLADIREDLRGSAFQEKTAVLEKTDGLLGSIDAIIESVQSIAMELRPSILDDIGLAAAMQWQANEFTKRTGIPCTFHNQVKPGMDRDCSTALFRIFQELLTNVARHAHATNVSASLQGLEDCIVMKVEDNGKGIPEEKLSSPRSIGLLGIRERIELFHGTGQITGIPGQGTTVTVTLPLPCALRRDTPGFAE